MLFDIRKPLHLRKLTIGRAQPIRAWHQRLRGSFILLTYYYSLLLVTSPTHSGRRHRQVSSYSIMARCDTRFLRSLRGASSLRIRGFQFQTTAKMKTPLMSGGSSAGRCNRSLRVAPRRSPLRRAGRRADRRPRSPCQNWRRQGRDPGFGTACG